MNQFKPLTWKENLQVIILAALLIFIVYSWTQGGEGGLPFPKSGPTLPKGTQWPW